MFSNGKHASFLLSLAALTVAVSVPTGSARAALILHDLTTLNSSATINSAIFAQGETQPFGSGVINSFLRIQNNGTEQGYNTQGTSPTPPSQLPFDTKSGISFNNGDVSVGSLASSVVTILGVPYYRLLLDINEPGNNQSLISLERLHVYTSPTHNQFTETFDANGDLVFPSLTTKRYDMDIVGVTDNLIRLDFNTASGGSGQSDMTFLLPTAALAGAAPTDAFYLFNRFGDADASDAGFEEWGFQVVPEPSSMVALAAVAMPLRRRR